MVVTFVASSNPSCVKYLDDLRLNKQRIEAKQILDILTSNKTKNHPAVLMWAGHTDALKVYINYCIRAWLKRGKKCELEEYDIDESSVTFPWWFSWTQLHLSHKCSLLRKDPGYYQNKFVLQEHEKPWLDHGYIWPSKVENINIDKVYKPEEVCSPIGAGAPAQYRWTVEDAARWNENKLVNPKTGRSIKKSAKAGIYKDLEKAYNYYLKNDML